MFIFWGTRITRRKLGRVADYCTICRGPRPFTLTRIGAATHVYGISFGQGKLAGYEAGCEICETPMDADAQEYVAVAQSEMPDFRTLTEKTNPGLKGLASERSELDSQVRGGRTDPEGRKSLLLEPFGLLNGMVERQRFEPRVSPRGRKVLWASFGIAIASVGAAAVFAPGTGKEEVGMAVVAGSILFGLFAFIGFRITAMGWFMRHEIEPRLVRSLGPLDPSLQELGEVRTELLGLKLRIGRKLDPNRIFQALQIAKTRPSA